MKRAAVFAHYDRDNIIDDYVIYYLKELKEIVEELVFVSCNELYDTEKSKLNGIADFVIAEKHDVFFIFSFRRLSFYFCFSFCFFPFSFCCGFLFLYSLRFYIRFGFRFFTFPFSCVLLVFVDFFGTAAASASAVILPNSFFLEAYSRALSGS